MRPKRSASSDTEDHFWAEVSAIGQPRPSAVRLGVAVWGRDALPNRTLGRFTTLFFDAVHRNRPASSGQRGTTKTFVTVLPTVSVAATASPARVGALMVAYCRGMGFPRPAGFLVAVLHNTQQWDERRDGEVPDLRPVGRCRFLTTVARPTQRTRTRHECDGVSFVALL